MWALIVIGVIFLAIVIGCLINERADTPVERPQEWPAPTPDPLMETNEDLKYGRDITNEDFEPREDDWKPQVGSWAIKETCHCGQVSGRKHVELPGSKYSYNAVCPKCGHSDRWEFYVAREEYELGMDIQWEPVNYFEREYGGYSAHKQFPDQLFRRVVGGASGFHHRNHKMVRWTEDKCEGGK
jgi:hypothetical protein